MDSLKKCGSRVGPANQGRRGGAGRRAVGRVRESESEREREALKSVSQGREDTSPGELDYPQTDGDRLDCCLTFFCFLHSFHFRPTEVTPGVSSCHSLMSQTECYVSV